MENKKTLDIIFKGTIEREELLFLFSAHIASNPDFKYNQTYLTDQISTFFNDYKLFQEKRNIFLEITKYIKDLGSNNHNRIEVLLDESFYYSENDEKELVSINFSLLKKNQIVLKLTQLSSNLEYSYSIKRDLDGIFNWKSKVNDYLKIANKPII